MKTGYHDNPRMLNIMGEELSKVSHYYTDAHRFYGMNVAVVGGNNSATEAALDLSRNGSISSGILRCLMRVLILLSQGFQGLTLESFRKEGYIIPLDIEPLGNMLLTTILSEY